MSSTKIATNPKHRADIPLCGRATTPLPYLAWYSNNPGVVEPLQDWIAAWVADAQKTTQRKPAGVFPQMVWTPTDTIGDPDNHNWWSNFFSQHGAGAFPSYQYYLYNLAGFFYLRTGEAPFRQPLDALQDLTLAWDAARRPDLGNRPPVGQEDLWCGSRLKSVGAGAVLNVAVGTGSNDWDAYLAAFGASYARYLQDPANPEPIYALDSTSLALKDSWPYRTTEGLMTDRIMMAGWADVISYYIGSEVFSTFFGMPVHAVTWSNTSRLFAASIHKATKSQVDVTTYLFSDQARTARIHLWQLEMGRDYVLEAGPTTDLGQSPEAIDQSIPFTLTRRGQAVAFRLPARQVYALAIRPVPTDSEQSTVKTTHSALYPDIAVAPADISYQTRTQELTVRVHNLGAAPAENITIRLFEGANDNGSLIREQTLTRLDAPLDLVPKWTDITVDYRPATWPTQVYVSLDTQNTIAEITKVNNAATAFLGASTPENAPPMIVEVLPNAIQAGQAFSLSGRNFLPGARALFFEAATMQLTVTFIDAEHLQVQTDTTVTPGDYIISIENPDGKRSNIMPLQVTP